MSKEILDREFPQGYKKAQEECLTGCIPEMPGLGYYSKVCRYCHLYGNCPLNKGKVDKILSKN